MTLTIHRGTDQIGGCVTEITSGKYRLFIDIGKNLPGCKTALPPVNGLTTGDGSNSFLFLTHYHGDHIGNLDKVLPGIPVYLGETAKAIQLTLAKRTCPEKLPMFERIETFTPGAHKKAGDFTVTTLMIDHSAFDAYMFLIECEGCRVLHTGDFRMHGQRGSKMPGMLSSYASNVDYVICEGTMLSRDGAPPISEHELQRRAKKMMETTPNVFVLCSSTNIDRISAFYHANPKGRYFICDSYQKEILDEITEEHGKKTECYDFKYALSYGLNLDKRMDENGFCMLVRKNNNRLVKNVLDKYKDNCLMIYSMWDGYLDGEAKDQKLCDFLAPYRDNPDRYKELHTSGHAPPEDLKRLFLTVNPNKGLIPIHSEKPELFRKIIPEDKLFFIRDREVFQLT